MGDGTSGIAPQTVATPVIGGLLFSKLAAGNDFTCGIATNGTAYCHGIGGNGQLGGGAPNAETSIPTAVAGGAVFVGISAGNAFACGLTGLGAVWCWGQGTQGQLGNGAESSSNTPVAVAGGLSFTSIACGYGHACGLNSSRAWCWGEFKKCFELWCRGG